MGLDMYAWRFKPKNLVSPEKINPEFVSLEDRNEFTKLDYWRKFNNLHGWMQDLFLANGGAGNFNCDKLRLDLEDLDRLEADAENLEPRGGFFFGSMNSMTPKDVEVIKAFCKKAREAIAEGDLVYYDSWW